MLSTLFQSALYPSEISALFRLKSVGNSKESCGPVASYPDDMDDIEFCWKVLVRVSRSFALVTEQLDEELRFPICLFYLVLRGLDSVEDDMDFPADKKIPLLKTFYTVLEDKDWNIENCGDSDDYRALMKSFHKVIRAYHTIKPEYREVISDITKRMGEGMAKQVEVMEATGKGAIVTSADYDMYCHYVAGLVGIGLCQLFAVSGLEDKGIATLQEPANSMGLFLQKTNIIRDYLEDMDSSRTWWPEEIWSKYSSELSWFKTNPDSEEALDCLNHMVYDALSLVPDVMYFMSNIKKNQSVYEFCAIPQCMAIATLAEVYDNRNVFKGVVKIRKGLSAKIVFSSSNAEQFRQQFFDNLTTIKQKANKRIAAKRAMNSNETDLTILVKTVALCDDMLERLKPIEDISDNSMFSTKYLFVASVGVAAVALSYLAPALAGIAKP